MSGRASTSRVQLAERVAVLRGQGRLQREIADELGISRSYAAELCTDPAGAKVRTRKNSYRQPCPRCGTLMDGSNGRNGHGPKLCSTCRHKEDHESRIWTAEAIIEAIRYFHAVHGRPPVAAEFTPALGKTAERREQDRQIAGDFPDVAAVQREFGGWNAGIRAAGFDPLPPGSKVRGFIKPPGVPRSFDYEEALRLHEQEGVTRAELARRYGVDRWTIGRAFQIVRSARDA